ncbi:MAG: succinylglutamate desuccinylase/aspartoacylase family protein [Myxococcota bacterium]
MNETKFQSFRFQGDASGPRLIVLGAVHGNETCGTKAIQTVLDELKSGAVKIQAGTVTFVPVANPRAYDLKQRAADRNLNRLLGPKMKPQDYEDTIANMLCPLLQEHDVLLDLHSFHTPGDAFALVGPENNQEHLEPFRHQEAETRLALHLGAQLFLEGWMGVYENGVKQRKASDRPSPAHLLSTDYGVGTTEYMRSVGGYGITYECGQHDDVEAPKRARYAIDQTLKLLGLIEGTPLPPSKDKQLLKLVDVVDRFDENDTMARDFNSFDRLQKGEKIGTRADGAEVFAETDGFIVFPNPDANVYAEWYYFAVESHRIM